MQQKLSAGLPLKSRYTHIQTTLSYAGFRAALGGNGFSTTSQAAQTVFVKYMKIGRPSLIVSFLAAMKSIFHGGPGGGVLPAKRPHSFDPTLIV